MENDVREIIEALRGFRCAQYREGIWQREIMASRITRQFSQHSFVQEYKLPGRCGRIDIAVIRVGQSDACLGIELKTCPIGWDVARQVNKYATVMPHVVLLSRCLVVREIRESLEKNCTVIDLWGSALGEIIHGG